MTEGASGNPPLGNPGAAPGSREARLHQSVKALLGCLTSLVRIAFSDRTTGHGLLLLDQLLQTPDTMDLDQASSTWSNEWRLVVRDLRRHHAEAVAQWFPGETTSESLAQLFTAAGDSTHIGPIRRLSSHDVIITVSGIALCNASVSEVDLFTVPQSAGFAKEVRQSVVRRRMFEAMRQEHALQEIVQSVDREYGKALQLLAARQPAAMRDDRVTYKEALAGRPDLGLPRTPKTTLRRWCQDPQAASDLGVNPKGKVSAQQPLVSGLLQLHAQKSSKRKPPQQRPKQRSDS